MAAEENAKQEMPDAAPDLFSAKVPQPLPFSISRSGGTSLSTGARYDNPEMGLWEFSVSLLFGTFGTFEYFRMASNRCKKELPGRHRAGGEAKAIWETL